MAPIGCGKCLASSHGSAHLRSASPTTNLIYLLVYMPPFAASVIAPMKDQVLGQSKRCHHSIWDSNSYHEAGIQPTSWPSWPWNTVLLRREKIRQRKSLSLKNCNRRVLVLRQASHLCWWDSDAGPVLFLCFVQDCAHRQHKTKALIQ